MYSPNIKYFLLNWISFPQLNLAAWTQRGRTVWDVPRRFLSPWQLRQEKLKHRQTLAKSSTLPCKDSSGRSVLIITYMSVHNATTWYGFISQKVPQRPRTKLILSDIVSALAVESMTVSSMSFWPRGMFFPVFKFLAYCCLFIFINQKESLKWFAQTSHLHYKYLHLVKTFFILQFPL